MPNGSAVRQWGNTCVSRTTLLAVYDGSDTLLQRFVYADDRMPVAMAAGGSVYYLAYNQVGSLRLVTGSGGTIIKRIEYDSFGNILSDSSPSFTIPFGFAGGHHDRDTGLVRFGCRDYLPEIGKWTAKDPIDFAGGDSNLYGYVANDSVNWIDPWGLKPPVEPNRLPPQFRPESLDGRSVDMLDFRPGGSEDVRGTMLDNSDYSTYDLTRPEMTDAGNYKYGYAGAKNGYSYEYLQSIADCDQYLSGKQNCYLFWPKDNPSDAANIRVGYNDYHHKMKK